MPSRYKAKSHARSRRGINPVKPSTPTKELIRCKTCSSAKPQPDSAPLSDRTPNERPTSSKTHLMNVSTTESTLENVFYSKKGAIAYVTPNRPKVLIALNHKAWAELRSQAEGLLSEASPFGLCAGTEDTNEGTRAFPQKHPVQFHARGTSNGEKEKSAVCYHPKGRF